MFALFVGGAGFSLRTMAPSKHFDGDSMAVIWRLKTAPVSATVDTIRLATVGHARQSVRLRLRIDGESVPSLDGPRIDNQHLKNV